MNFNLSLVNYMNLDASSVFIRSAKKQENNRSPEREGRDYKKSEEQEENNKKRNKEKKEITEIGEQKETEQRKRIKTQ